MRPMWLAGSFATVSPIAPAAESAVLGFVAELESPLPPCGALEPQAAARATSVTDITERNVIVSIGVRLGIGLDGLATSAARNLRQRRAYHSLVCSLRQLRDRQTV